MRKSLKLRRDMKVRAHVFISGRVQGVFFRVETRNRAMRRNITGWVRNTFDDRVEAIFEGEKEDVEELIEFCRKGPSGARVMKVDVQWEEHAGEFRDFKIRRSAIF
jgi:acylphosphatase